MRIPEGVIVAMLTPFDDDGKINEIEVRRLVNFLIDKKVDGIFPVSTCGEYVHLDMAERKYLIDIVVDEAAGRIDIIPGTGATCYSKSIELASYAKQKGCSAVVLHGPYFFKNPEEVVESHLRRVAESVDIPIFLYNIPFFANEVTPDIAERLCSMPNVVGIKDSSGNMINVMNLLEMTKKINPNFKILVGVEEIFLPALLMGANGCMTATAGIMPEFMVGIYKAYKDGNFNLAYNLQFSILSLIREMKSVNFPQGFKEALSVRGIKMGPPKMAYPTSILENIANLRVRLEMEMEDLLSKYFTGIPLKYLRKDLALERKFSYPDYSREYSSSSTSTKTLTTKKHEDCTMCGMCEGDRDKPVLASIEKTVLKTEVQSLGDTKCVDSAYTRITDIDEERLKDIVTRVVKEIIEKM